ncbi:hypothetical protein [Reinekea marinisedimentorum]|uniref:Uncharacterized protein n=1 Tax=Reinekea marinisedimentorum TaxID=230495 RepID=A0A4R3IBU9_9GAMM|nr:hypothetical protein [Reinekea marinisedimentorum]TCS41988.1 hypothetical protein BCF53_10492 [Reinekea marinisedimentorum]
MTQINFEDIKPLFTPLTMESMKEQWGRLHAGDCEARPKDEDLLAAWLLFHNGEYLQSAEKAKVLPGGASLYLKASATYAYYLEADAEKKTESLKACAQQAETALREEQESRANLYYQLAYALGRYGQFISITKALAEGLAGKVQHAIKECLQLEPDHADAHTSLGTYQAEIIGKLGKMAAKLTYSSSADDALGHYQKAIELAPYSVSAITEFADGLLKMFGKKRLKDAVNLYQRATENTPIDALEAMDYYLARKELDEA